MTIHCVRPEDRLPPLERVAAKVTRWVGTSWAFILAAGLTAAWLVTGPFFHYSDTWQLVMNTVSSIVTFLMVFLIQRSQNKDTTALQVKLNELIAATKGASNKLIDIEDLSEEELDALRERCVTLAERARREKKLTEPLSIEQPRRKGNGHLKARKTP
jgi:low affinity Fe/Cu permease